MGGKSGLFFYKTMDDQLVLKQMSKFEYLAFLDFPSLSRSMKFLDKNSLNQEVKRDTKFPASHSHRKMDFSLLIGICDKKSVLVVGISDYIRSFMWRGTRNWKRKLESWF